MSSDFSGAPSTWRASDRLRRSPEEHRSLRHRGGHRREGAGREGAKGHPKIFQFRTHAENKSLYNTPPTFGVYMVRNVLAWLKGLGGLPAMEALNRKKAARLYGAIDANPAFYRSPSSGRAGR